MERQTKWKTPVMAVVLLVMSGIQLLLCMSGYIMNNVEQLLVMVLCAAAVVTMILALYAWDSIKGFRRATRAILMAVPSILFAAGVGVAAYASIFRPADSVLLATGSASFGYNLIASLSFTMLLAQVVQAFFLPTLVAAASFGNRLDVIHLRVQAVVNAVLVLFNVFVSSTSIVGLPVWATEGVVMPTWQVPNILVAGGQSDLTLMQLIAAIAAVVFAAACFVPILRKTPEDSAE